jgi:hypothetical protein
LHDPRFRGRCIGDGVSRALDPAALAVFSDATAFGDVREVHTVWEKGLIWTVATLDLVDEDATADVWIPGGCIGAVCLTIPGAPLVDEGERVFVFLREQQPTGLAQGLFHVDGGEAVRDMEGVVFANGDHARMAYDVEELERVEGTVRRSP